MPARSLALLLLLVAGASCGEGRAARSRAGASRFLRARAPVPRRYLVVLAPGATTAARVESDARDLAARHQGAVLQSWKHALSGFAASMEESDAVALSQEPRVAWVEEDGLVELDATEMVAPWNLDRIDQSALPLDGRYDYPFAGAGVTAYVIDTGVRSSHRELAGRVARGFTSIADGRSTEDCNGHGTHVAGIIGGTTYGVAKGVRLVPVRVLDCTGSGPVSDVVSGIDWVTANHVAPAVANISLGTDGSATLDAAVQRAIAAGVTFTAAAGNGGIDACTRSPARVPGALTVGATDQHDAQAPFSNWGPCVDVYAPGVAITSAWGTSDLALNTLSGTSMAAPVLAGTAALWLGTRPSASPAQVAAAIGRNASAGVGQLGTGSPDRLVFTGFVSGVTGTASAVSGSMSCEATADALVDGGFEERSAAWIGSPGTVDGSAFPGARTGRWKGWLAGYGSTHEDELSQTFAIPADACAVRLTFWLRVATDESLDTANDVLTVSVSDPSDGTETWLATFSNRDAGDWVQHVLDLGAYHGRTVALRFRAAEDAILQTSFLLDDVAVTVSRP